MQNGIEYRQPTPLREKLIAEEPSAGARIPHGTRWEFAISGCVSAEQEGYIVRDAWQEKTRP